MKRRFFLQSSSAAVAIALTGCGGGGGGGTAATADVVGTAVPETGAGAAMAAPGMPLSAPVAGQAPISATVRTAGMAYPFGARLDPYIAGIQPTVVSKAQMDSIIRTQYDAWKAKAVVDVPTVPGGKAIKFGTSPDYLAVSEGFGYGMLIAVLMAGHDPGAKALFDSLLTTVRARHAYSVPDKSVGRYLMDWRLTIDGSSTDAAGGGWNALDGDMDIAMALLMADRQWGSQLTWNYRQEAVGTINAMRGWGLKPDGTTKGLGNPNVSRTSDYMIGHFRAFKKATGDTIWDLAIDRAYALIDRMQTVYAPNTGLMPDFIVATDTANPYPSPGFMGDGNDREHDYSANAMRNPWRWGTDYVLSGDARWKSVCQKMTNFIEADSQGDPNRIPAGYHLDGKGMETYPSAGMVGSMLGGAMVDSRYQAFLNSLWTWNAKNLTTSYYDSECQLIPMIVASGNWWNA